MPPPSPRVLTAVTNKLAAVASPGRGSASNIHAAPPRAALASASSSPQQSPGGSPVEMRAQGSPTVSTTPRPHPVKPSVAAMPASPPGTATVVPPSGPTAAALSAQRSTDVFSPSQPQLQQQAPVQPQLPPARVAQPVTAPAQFAAMVAAPATAMHQSPALATPGPAPPASASGSVSAPSARSRALVVPPRIGGGMGIGMRAPTTARLSVAPAASAPVLVIAAPSAAPLSAAVHAPSAQAAALFAMLRS